MSQFPSGSDLSSLPDRMGPWQVFAFPVLESTSTWAADALDHGPLRASRFPALVVAARQTAGRGQRDHIWCSGEGDLTATFVCHDLPEPPGRLAIRAAVAAQETLVECGVTVGIKWPNDLLHDRRKIGGILCERRGRASLVGIGINVAGKAPATPTSYRRPAISLADLGSPIDRWTLLEKLALRMAEDVVATSDWERVRERYSSADVLRDCRTTLDTPQGSAAGIARGIDPEGRLLLEIDGQHQTFASASVADFTCG